jgi:hypothetical protein
MGKAYRVLCGKLDRKNRLENPGTGGRLIIKLQLGCVMDDTGSGKGTIVDLLNTVINLRVPRNTDYFLPNNTGHVRTTERNDGCA